VIVMTTDGHAVHRDDPYLSGPAATPVPLGAPGADARVARGTVRTVRTELSRLRRSGAITVGAYRRYSSTFNAALSTEKRLTGTRAAELEAVIENLHQIAASGRLIPSRLPVLFQTLDRNRQWWTTGPLLTYGQRVEFTGSNLVWQYYPGQGIELQVLGTFGRADGLYTAGRASYPQLISLLRQMIPLAARRGGGLTWEYYFKFDGGIPPWTSAMSQGTGLEALTRGYQATGNRSYLKVASRALSIFYRRPKIGVRELTSRGARYLQYSFAPGVDIINAFLQSLIGLYDYSKVSGNKAARRLFTAGDAQAQAELSQFDTGAWSLYQPGEEDDLSYHELVTGFLHDLCIRTKAIAYCTTAERFDDYLHTAPVLTLLTHRVKVRNPSTIRFRLSKVSKVGIVVARGTQTVFETSASFSYGTHSFAIPALSRRGRYQVRLAATDLAGNFGRVVGTVRVS
jgi:D-glucuronyl C5-epimerase-like protein